MNALNHMHESFRRALLETVPCSVFVVDGDNRILFWNRSAEELTQYRAEEVVGLLCNQLPVMMCAQQNEAVHRSFCPLLANGQCGEVECEIQRKDGTLIPVVRRSRPVYDEEGRLIGAIEALVDVSLIKKARTEIRVLRHEIAECGRYDGLIGCSQPMRRLYHMIQTVAQTDAPVVIEGETGTGKELVAKTLHQQSRREGNLFLALNCGAVPESLLEGELFGHKRGAFTGAVDDRAGCFEAACGGTLFLDEIGEMPLAFQVKLLRVLQENEITRLGESHPRPIDVRVIAATNRNLAEQVRAGKFRQDLFYRLHVVALTLPPLRERREDIADLVTHFIDKLNKRYGRHIGGCDPEAMQRLQSHIWPGNIRELEHAVEHAFVVSTRDRHVLTSDCLPEGIRGGQGAASQCKTRMAIDPPDETTAVKAALQQTHGNKAAAARLLGVTRAGLYKKLRRLGL
jgi:PAS domain S-box-containing protein